MSRKFQTKPSWKNVYHEVDSRASNDRRTGFKSNKHNKNKGNKDWTNSVKAHLLDEDIDMGNIAGPSRSGNNKYSKRGNRTGSGGNRNMKKQLFEGPTGWYRVTLPYGNKYDKSFLQQFLLEKISPLPLIPIAWKASGNGVTFYVDDFKVADKLYSLDFNYQMPDGFKLIIKVNYGSPNVDISDEIKEKMKLAMASRYNAVNKALDLTKFHVDPMLKDHFCALFKPIILIAVIEIIAENIPELEALCLSDNKIHVITFLKEYVNKLKNVKILHLGQNRIKEISMLDSLSGMQLQELFLDGNPVCNRFKDKTLYISEIRSRFPKILKLDGIELPPQISFDLEDDHKLPSSLQTFLCNAEGGPIVRQFLEQYFRIYDSDDRQLLLQAYHENAVFSMTMAYPYGTRDKTANWLNWYTTDNRNILRLTDSDRRVKLLKKGNISIISFLKEMPMSSHDMMNFKVDLTVYTPIMMSLTISGMFKELKSGHKHAPIRSFFRTLIIVPAGSGYCITNEELHITNATSEQIKIFKTTPPPAPIVSSPAAAIATPVNTSLNNGVDDTTKKQMVEALATQSGMNLEWAAKCLEETEWNFERATNVFNQVHKQGGIPPEAFVK